MKHPLSEQILSVAEREVLHRESIRANVLKNAPKRRAFPWKRVLIPVAACLVLLCATVLTIPEARAEVFRWFHIEGPVEYLLEKPEERTSVDALDVLIVPPVTAAPEQAASPAQSAPSGSDGSAAAEPAGTAQPVGSVTDNRILQVCDEPIWRQIAEDFSMELGETMFDGHDMYLSIAMHGLTALPEIEAYTGGNATQVRIGRNDLKQYFEGGEVPEEFASESVSLYEPMKGRFWLRLDDGTDIPFGPSCSIDLPTDSPFGRNSEFARKEILTDADRAKIAQAEIDWLQGRTLRGVVRKYDIDRCTDCFIRNGDPNDRIPVKDVLGYLLSRTDENGILSGTVRYVVASDVTGKNSVRLEAELGTASFDLNAYRSVETRTAKAAEATVTWNAETVLISKVDVDHGANADSHKDDRISLYQQRVSTEGMTMTAQTAQAEISALGIREIGIRVDVPASWTREDREALAESLTFRVLLNGEDGDWIVSPYGCAPQEDGSVLFLAHEILNVPYDVLKSLRTISFVPVIRSVRTVELTGEKDGRHYATGTLETECGKTAWSPEGFSGWNEHAETTAYPQYAITLTVD